MMGARTAFLSIGLACVAASAPVYAQTAPAIAAPSGDHGSAYYAFAMAHLYGELAQAYGNRGEYVNKAIDFYRQAMKLDPNAVYIGEELAGFYIQTGQMERAVQQASDLIKANPDSVGAHKILGRIYSKQIGDPEQGKVDQAMLKSAIAEYQKVADLDPKDTEDLGNLARLYHVAHDEAGAEKTYKAIIAADPNDEDAVAGLAIVYADRGDMPGAIALLKSAAEKNPDVRIVTTLAEMYESDKQFSQAADAWKEALPLTNDNLTVRRHYVQNLLDANRGSEAVSALQALASDDPKNPEFLLQLIGVYEQQRDFASADAALLKAKAIGNTPQIRLAEAQLLNAEGKTGEAIDVLQAVLSETKKAQYSNDERAQRIQIVEMTAELQKKAERTQEAAATFRQISELNPQVASKVEVEVIATLAAGRDYKAAREAADAAVKKYPGDKVVLMEHASLLGELAQYDAAINEFRAMPDAANDRDIQIQIAEIQKKAKRYADEQKTLDRAESISTNEQEKQGIALMRGEMLQSEKNFDAAEQIVRNLLKTSPNNPNALNYLGYMFAERGVKLDEAQQLVSKALQLDPGNGAYLDSLGWVHYRQNHLDQAADELRQALDKIGRDATVHDHLGEVYFKQGKIKEAIQQWEASVTEMKKAPPSDQDPEELSKITRKLENAKVRVAEKH